MRGERRCSRAANQLASLMMRLFCPTIFWGRRSLTIFRVALGREARFILFKIVVFHARLYASCVTEISFLFNTKLWN